MEVELLHIHHGDKKKHIDTTLPEGKNEVDRLFRNLCQQKCAIFLERGTETYRITGYDRDTDELIIEVPKRRGRKPKGTPLSDRMKIADAKATCRIAAQDAKVAAVAPVAGGSAAWWLWEILRAIVGGFIGGILGAVYVMRLATRVSTRGN